MSQNNLEALFTLVQQAAQELKGQDPYADGKAFWQPLKKIFRPYSFAANSWKQLNPDLVKKLIGLPETDSLGQTIEINHFLRQHVRIPLEEQPNLRRIMQIALNSGQYMGLTNYRHFNSDFAQATIRQNLDFPLVANLEDFDYERSQLHRLQTYLAPLELESLGQKITKSQIIEVKNVLS